MFIWEPVSKRSNDEVRPSVKIVAVMTMIRLERVFECLDTEINPKIKLVPQRTMFIWEPVFIFISEQMSNESIHEALGRDLSSIKLSLFLNFSQSLHFHSRKSIIKSISL